MHDHTREHAPRWILRPRQQRWLERLLDNELAPLHGFLGRADYDSVLAAMHLADGTPWPFPVTLDVDEAFAATLDAGARIALCSPHGEPLARLDLSDIYYPDHLREARLLYGHMDRRHPAIVQLLRHTGAVYLGGRVHHWRGVAAPRGPLDDATGIVSSSHDLWGGNGSLHAIEPVGACVSHLLH
jgi:sulfate adenylyltransferase